MKAKNDLIDLANLEVGDILCNQVIASMEKTLLNDRIILSKYNLIGTDYPLFYLGNRLYDDNKDIYTRSYFSAFIPNRLCKSHMNNYFNQSYEDAEVLNQLVGVKIITIKCTPRYTVAFKNGSIEGIYKNKLMKRLNHGKYEYQYDRCKGPHMMDFIRTDVITNVLPKYGLLLSSNNKIYRLIIPVNKYNSISISDIVATIKYYGCILIDLRQGVNFNQVTGLTKDPIIVCNVCTIERDRDTNIGPSDYYKYLDYMKDRKIKRNAVSKARKVFKSTRNLENCSVTQVLNEANKILNS